MDEMYGKIVVGNRIFFCVGWLSEERSFFSQRIIDWNLSLNQVSLLKIDGFLNGEFQQFILTTLHKRGHACYMRARRQIVTQKGEHVLHSRNELHMRQGYTRGTEDEYQREKTICVSLFDIHCVYP